MNLLDKIKKAAQAAAVFIPGVGPFVTLATAFTKTTKDDAIAAAVIQRAPSEIAGFMNIVARVEHLAEYAKTKGGSVTAGDKALMAANEIADSLHQVELMTGYDIVDEEGIKKAASMYAEATVLLAKSIRPKKD